MKINWAKLLLIHTICPAINRLFIMKWTLSKQLLYTQVQLITQHSETSSSNSYSTIIALYFCVRWYWNVPPPSLHLNKMLFSLQGAIDMNGDSYINSRLLFQSPPHWGLGQTLHDSALTLLLLFTLGLCLPGNHWPTILDSLPLQSQRASEPPGWMSRVLSELMLGEATVFGF